MRNMQEGEKGEGKMTKEGHTSCERLIEQRWDDLRIIVRYCIRYQRAQY